MKQRIFRAFKRHEIDVVVTLIGIVFIAAMGIVAWTLRGSMDTPPYETLKRGDLQRVFATGYLRFREDDGTPYLKVVIHNGTMWWIKKAEFAFDGTQYAVRDADAFRPLHSGAVRCTLKRAPVSSEQIEFDLNILQAHGYPPAQVQWDRSVKKANGVSRELNPHN